MIEKFARKSIRPAKGRIDFYDLASVKGGPR